MEDFLALQKQVEQMQEQIRYLMGNELTWLTIDQTAQALNCSKMTVHRITKAGKLTPRYEGSKPLYEVAQIREYIESTRVSPRMANKRIQEAKESGQKRKTGYVPKL